MAPKAAAKNMKRGGNKHGAKKGGSGGGVKKGSIGSGGDRKPNLKKKSKLVITFDPEKRVYVCVHVWLLALCVSWPVADVCCVLNCVIPVQ